MSELQDLSQLSPEELAVRAEEAQQALYQLARKDINVFLSVVMTDDSTGVPLVQAPIHRRWHQLLDEHDRCIIWASVHSGKTTQLSVGRALFSICNNPNIRIGICSSSGDQAEKIVSSIANYLQDPIVQKIFPEIRPDFAAKWTKKTIQVVRSSKAKDPTVRGFGAGIRISGARFDLLILDDILDEPNVRTQGEREKMISWFLATLPGRLTKKARVVCVGTAWHTSDLYHFLKNNSGYKWFRFPVIDAKGQVSWPSHYTEELIAQKKKELGPAEFARQMLCLVRDEASAKFQKSWFDAAKEKGQLCEIVQELDEVPEGCRVVCGVDLSSGRHNSKRKKTDQTVFFIVLVHPNEDQQILNIEAGKWSAPLIIEKIQEIYERYARDVVFVVEDVGAQIYIQQVLNHTTAIPIVPHTTTGEKWDPILGIESLAIALYNGKYIIPSASGNHPAIEKWIEECLFFSPQVHSGDTLMASYFLKNYLRTFGRKSVKANVMFRVIGGGKSSRPQPLEDDSAEAVA